MACAIDRLKTCLDDVKKWFSANKFKINPDKTEFIIFGSKICEKLNNFSQLIFLVISSLLLRQSGTLVCGLILIFPFRGMSRISVSPVLLKSGILSISEVI